MAYNVLTSAGGSITVSDGTINSADTNLQLIGRNKANYGEPMAQNLVRMLENFASAQDPVTNPNVAGSAVTGQLWYDTNNSQLNVWNGASWDGITTGTIGGGGSIGAVGDPVLELFATTIGSVTEPVVNLYATNADIGTATIDTLTAGGNPSSMTGAWALTTGSSFVLQGTATMEATYADLAERFAADAEYDFGTVVSLGGAEEVTVDGEAFSENILGVVAKDPAFIMNREAGTNETHPPIALAGRTPTKVIGKVSKGDRLVQSSTPGVAIAVTAETREQMTSFSVIGRALEDKATDELGLVWVVVGVK